MPVHPRHRPQHRTVSASTQHLTPRNGTIWQFFQFGKHTDLDRLRPRRVFRRLKFERHVELLPLHSSESPRLERAGSSFSMSDGLSLTAKGVKEGRLAVSVLLIARCLSVGDYRQVRQPGG